jgi:HD-like signal output (HDOD) protein
MPVASAQFSREKILQIARSLPADLQVLSALGEMLQDVNSELDEIATLLRRDVALAARIVRIGNSPMFGGGGGIASIEEAVNRVGFSEILKLVGTATTARYAERALEHYKISALKLRDNMLYGAFAAEALAQAVGVDPRMAYTAGLLRPLGMMVLDRAGRGNLQWTDHFDPARFPTYSAWEGSIFGIDSLSVSALILEEWRFPREVIGAIRSHHLDRPEDFENQLACVLNLAGGLTNREGRAFVGEIKWWDITPEKLQGLGLAPEHLEPVVATTTAAFEAAVSALAI